MLFIQWIAYFSLIITTALSNQDMIIESPNTHVAFTGNFSISIQSSGRFNGTSIAVTVTRHENYSITCDDTYHSDTSRLRIPCICFDRAGIYELQISKIDSNFTRTLLGTKSVRVRWPKIALKLPLNRTLSHDHPVPVEMTNFDDLSCAPNLSISIQRAISDNVSDQFTEIALLPLRNLNETMLVSCGLFMRPGLYQATLIERPDSDQSIMITRSNMMNVTVSASTDDYDLRVVGHYYVYPCPEKGLSISYRRPIARGCIDWKNYDAIRLYAAQPRTKSSKSDDVFLTLKHSYVAEEKLPPIEGGDKKRSAGVAFVGCNHFDLIYPEYCFQLATVYDNGMVLERSKHCIPTQSTKYIPIQGQWSPWQSWGSCTITCGASGVQHRIRYCNRPEPIDGGRFCTGDGLETRLCSVESCPLPPINQSIPPDSHDMDHCSCGCNLTQSQETLIMGVVKCTNNHAYWHITPELKDQLIELAVIKLQFQHPHDEWIKIKEQFDSEKPDILLLDSTSSDFYKNHLPITLKSRANGLLIEYFSNINASESTDFSILRKSDPNDHWYGVLIRYKFVSSIDYRSIDTHWWNRMRLDERWFLIFIICVTLISLISLIAIYVFAAKYTLKKLRSKCHYLMLMSQTTQASTSQCPLGSGSPYLAHESEIVNLRNDDTSDTNTKEPLLIKRGQKKKSRHHQRDANNLARIPEEMQTSTNTESTRLSASPASPQMNGSQKTPKSMRSIGIQLNSPALSTLRRHTSSDRCQINNHKTQSSNTVRPDSPNFSFAGTEQDDFEYDYYDAPVPGSVFNYQHSQLNTTVVGAWRSSYFETDIDIDDIIEQSHLMNDDIGCVRNGIPTSPIMNMVSVSTQSHPILATGDSAESSEWSFKWTKPSTATTQFHFL